MPKITFNRWPKTETEFKRLMMTVKAHCRLCIDMPNKCMVTIWRFHSAIQILRIFNGNRRPGRLWKLAMSILELPEGIDRAATLRCLRRIVGEDDLTYFIRRAWHTVEPETEYVEGGMSIL